MAELTTFAVGQGVEPNARITRRRRAVDPVTVECHISDPDGTKTSYVYGTDDELVRDETGLYHLELTPESVGEWTFRWETTSPDTACRDRTFTVVETIFT